MADVPRNTARSERKVNARFDMAATRGRWPDLLASMGLDDRALSGKHGPCPFCGGKDRFRFTDHEGMGRWVCNVCGHGDGMQLVQQLKGVDFVGAIKAVEALLPTAVAREIKPKAPPRDKLNRLWSNAARVSADDPVGEYLLTRGVWSDDASSELRFAEAVPYFHNGVHHGYYNAMLARVRDGRGRPTTLHCTYISGGGKAPVDSPKKVLSAMGDAAAIRLFPATHRLALAEGIETALAVHRNTGWPVWSCISAGGMKAVEIPASVTEVMICADNDESFTGQAAAYALAQRLAAAGKLVQVRVPEEAGLDFADPPSWAGLYKPGRV
jgi:putative DNA primase/helicase